MLRFVLQFECHGKYESMMTHQSLSILSSLIMMLLFRRIQIRFEININREQALQGARDRATYATGGDGGRSGATAGGD